MTPNESTASVFPDVIFSLKSLLLRLFHINFSATLTRKNVHLPYSIIHAYVLSEFLTVDRSYTTKYFWKNSYWSWLVTSLRFFWHLLRPDWPIIRSTAFGRIRNRRHFPSKTAILPFSNIFQRLTVPRMIDQYWHKRCQKKRKDVDYKLL